jgi:hypothetical protein
MARRKQPTKIKGKSICSRKETGKGKDSEMVTVLFEGQKGDKCGWSVIQ